MTVKTTHGMKDLPDDFTPVCTTEFCAFAKRDNEFQAREEKQQSA